MAGSKRILKVPQESFVRNRLRKETRLLVEQTGLRPPAFFPVMEKMACDLLKKLNISEEFVDFTIVLLGNETWRRTVEATPFDRRLLLLPQCLKNNANCRGVFDELGLNCTGCKACPIDDILLEAEKLGYATLVAEGTTVAIGLVEEGAIDAVIGVSCMPVLQRSFDAVTNAAVPVIGLPLMHNGCENTNIDKKWLYDELKAHRPNDGFQPLSVSALKSKLEDFFSNGSLANWFDTAEKSETLALELVQVGGQRMRPLLSALTFEAYSGAQSDDVLLRLSLIIECFHKASLVHDDIQDNTDLRYKTQTAHKKYGVPQAINIGDLLIGKGYRLLSELPVEPSLIATSLAQVSRSHLKLTHGQGADIRFNAGGHFPDLEETLAMFSHKTGEAIKVALLLGAILGGADEPELKVLADFSEKFGISYQIRDDLNEFAEQQSDEKLADYPFLVSLLSAENLRAENISDFRALIAQYNLQQKAESVLAKHIEMCYSELDKLQNGRLRLALYGVLGKIFKPMSADAL